MKVAFRADASLQIGTGHVMRCLTLADELRRRGAECHFICREHAGNLIALVEARGFEAHKLTLSTPARQRVTRPNLQPPHSAWLGATQSQDRADCQPILAALCPDWLVVDHYALDAAWEAMIHPYCGRLMVLDDLTDRPHRCELLLDQTFGRDPADYAYLVPHACTLLCGSRYALLRPEFADLRAYSLGRREHPQAKRLLITLGGVDKVNVTGRILDALPTCQLPTDCHISIVMGPHAPWLSDIKERAAKLPWPSEVHVGISNMAELMANSDLAIGAAGSTSWERCCLGLPTLMVVLAQNQAVGASLLERTGAAWKIDGGMQLPENLRACILRFLNSPELLTKMSLRAREITDGNGCIRVADIITNSHQAGMVK